MYVMYGWMDVWMDGCMDGWMDVLGVRFADRARAVRVFACVEILASSNCLCSLILRTQTQRRRREVSDGIVLRMFLVASSWFDTRIGVPYCKPAIC